MIMIGYFGLFIIILICMIIGIFIMALCRISSECSREEEREFDKASCRPRDPHCDAEQAAD